MALKNFERATDHALSQFTRPLYSTIAYDAFLAKHECFRDGKVMDMGAGPGSVMNYMAKNHPNVDFLGVDYNEFNTKLAQGIEHNQGISNISFEAGDWFDLSKSYKGAFDGIFSVHSLCCFKRIEPAIEALAKLEPRWISFNSLFYEGPLDVMIHIRDHSDHSDSKIADDNPDADFNIFSLDLTRDCFAKAGYKKLTFERFEIPVQMPRMPEGKRGTYTVTTEWSPRTQFSGPVHLPWYFVLAQRQ